MIALPLAMMAQGLNDIKNHPEKYLYGEGWGKTVEEADQAALSMLISQISVAVSSQLDYFSDEIQVNDTYDSKTYVNSKISTYTQSALTNTQVLSLADPPNAHVARFILKSELDRIFAGRKLKVKEFVALGADAEKRLKVDDALRYYFWAYSLLKSVPHASEETYVDADGEHVLETWLHHKMDDIFSDIRVECNRRGDTDVELFFTFRGKPVTSMDYSYFDGSGWTSLYSAKDGRGVLELVPGAATTNVGLKIEYEYRGQAMLDKEIEAVLAVVKGAAFRKSKISVRLDGSAATGMGLAAGTTGSSTGSAAREVKVQGLTELVEDRTSDNSRSLVERESAKMADEISSNVTAVQGASSYQDIIDAIVMAIQRKNYESVRKHFTTEGYKMFQRLIHYGNARVIKKSACEFYTLRDKVVGRSLPMSFAFANGNRKKFVEDVVFTFDRSKKIESLAFGLGNEAMGDVMRKPWSQQAKLTIVEFLENYKTAFALERIDYLRSIFDDNAIIIVGTVTKKGTLTPSERKRYIENEKVKFNRLTKDEYLRNLQRTFDSNEFVNIRFTNNRIGKTGSGGEEYGIQIKQDYYSTHYGDTGYLFLKADITNPDEPVIKVRTWQPTPDMDGSIYGMGDF